MTQDELEEQIKELVDDYLMANDEDVDITINMQCDDMWIRCNFSINIEEV